jgi:predicted NAD-dependent protein-ADP-ribosyltransferase YbiA (DUF1768 family)
MKVILKSGVLILVPETEAETAELHVWKTETAGHVLYARQDEGSGLALMDIGSKPNACNEPIQVSSMVKDPAIGLIGNFADTPFTLDERKYASIESFWQGLKFEREADRRRIAALPGRQARRAGEEAGYGATITYAGAAIPVGTWQHWALMERACQAKFTQNDEAREALLATGRRPLQHKLRRDSKSIPGVIMAEICMRIRGRLRNEVEEETGD